MVFEPTAEVQHTSAPTEAEMTSVANLFNRMRDAIIDASHLAGEVAGLRKEVGDFRHEIEELRSTNRWLNEQNMSLLKARDTAEDEARRQSEARLAAEQSLASEQREHGFTKGDLDAARASVALANKDRDDAQFRVMELDEELTKVKAALAAVTAAIEGVKPKPVVVEMPKAPEPMQEAPKPTGTDWIRGGW